MCHSNASSSNLLTPPRRQQEESKPPVDIPRSSTDFPIRSIGGGGAFQFPTHLTLSPISALTPTDGIETDFNEIDTQALAGAFLSVTLAFGSFEMGLFVNYRQGSFDAPTQDQGRQVSDGHGGFATVIDSFDLKGDLWLVEFGVAPVLWNPSTEDGTFSLRLAPALGIYFGALHNMEVNCSGSVVESFSVADERILGAFIGPTAQARLRVAKGLHLNFDGAFFRLFGNARGWEGMLLLGFGGDF